MSDQELTHPFKNKPILTNCFIIIVFFISLKYYVTKY